MAAGTETGTQATFSARCVASIHDVDQGEWDRCAGDDNPFVRHAFLACLEDSGSATAATGWASAHVLLETPGGRLAAAAPTYLKSHSMGEFVFDQGLADAFERAGGRYYPKLLVAVPFSPVTGPRLLTGAGPADGLRGGLASAFVRLARNAGASSVHVNFLTDGELRSLARSGFLGRTGLQFHWRNREYGSFDDFLGSLSSRKRKAIRRERREATAGGVTIHRLTGDGLTADVWDAFYAFYRDTGDRKWGIPYLTREFFEMLGERMGRSVLLVMGRRDGRWIAGALNIMSGSTLYGRYWGAIEDHRMLHFECCYYQAIEHAIDSRLACVEAGAQGGHKIQRGYMPVPTHSAHWFAHSGMHEAVARIFEREKEHVGEQADFIEHELSPFRRS